MAEIIKVKTPLLKKGYHRMTLPFGDQKLKGEYYYHKGIDLTGDTNVSGGYDDILAFADGTVTIAGWRSDCGYWVKISHGNGIFTRYMHMKKGSLKVKVGDKVKKGQVIGFMGTTGNVTGRHLHFDICINGAYFDPVPYLLGTKALEISEISKYTPGTYRVVKAVNVRTGPGTKYPRVMYDDFTANAKEQIKKLGGKPEDNDFPAGMVLDISKVDGTNGKCPSGWVSLNLCKKEND